MNDKLNIALLQHSPTPEALKVSLSRIAHQASIAADAGNDLLLLPEASLTGYNISLSAAQEMAEHKEGSAFNSIAKTAQHYRIAIAYGYIERDGNTLYNSVQMVSDEGLSIGHYRKTHLWGDLDRQLFKAGDAFSPLTEFKGWKIGLLICYDVEFPETVRHLALSGADLILIPTALMHPWDFVATHVTRVRAAENQVYLAYANYCGSENTLEYAGKSCIAGPDGEAIASADTSEVMLNATLSKQAILDIREKLPYHNDRRDSLYRQRDDHHKIS